MTVMRWTLTQGDSDGDDGDVYDDIMHGGYETDDDGMMVVMTVITAEVAHSLSFTAIYTYMTQIYT